MDIMSIIAKRATFKDDRPMVTLTSKEAKDKFGVLMDTARKEPVTITKHNNPAVVVISSERYAELEALEERFWSEKAKEAEGSGILAPEESAAFLREKLDAGN